MENDKGVVPSAEELEAERASLADVKEDDIRAKVIEEFGFDETADAEKITKLVGKEVDSRKKLSKAIEQKIKHRTEAEELRKKVPTEVKSTVTTPDPKQDLSTTDIYALIEAKVLQEDIPDMIELAKFRKVSVAEAIKSTTGQIILKEKAEKRAVADATNTGATRRTPTKPSDEALLEKASKGILPETDEEMERLAAARLAQMKRKK